METKIKEVQDYFKQKILNEEFEILEVTEHYVQIKIDNKYQFTIWIANGFQYFGTATNFSNFIELKFSESQKIACYEIFKDIFNKTLKHNLIQEYEEKIKALKND